MSTPSQINLLATPFVSPVQGDPQFTPLAHSRGVISSPPGDYSYISHPSVKLCAGKVTEVTVDGEPVEFSIALGHVIQIARIDLTGQAVAFVVQDDSPYLRS